MKIKNLFSILLIAVTIFISSISLAGCSSKDNKNNLDVLLDVIENTSQTDFSISTSAIEEDLFGTDYYSTTFQHDKDNHILKNFNNDKIKTEISYVWQKDNLTYSAFLNNDSSELPQCYKSIGNFSSNLLNEIKMPITTLIEKDGVGYDFVYTVVEQSKKDNYYYLEIKIASLDETATLKYRYTESHLLSFESLESEEDYSYTCIEIFDYIDINLTLPAEIKILENTAVISANIFAVEQLLYNYLQENLVVKKDGKTFLSYDKDLKIANYNNSTWLWVSNNNLYKTNEKGDSLIQDDAEEFEDSLINLLSFNKDYTYWNDLNKHQTVELIENNKYYKVSATSTIDNANYTFILGEDYIKKVTITDANSISSVYTFHETEVELSVPANLKALESTAVKP